MSNDRRSSMADGPPSLEPEIIDPAGSGSPDRRPTSDRRSAEDAPGDGATGAALPAGSIEPTESIEKPAKLLRIGSMVKQLLEEVRQAPLDELSRGRLREIYEQSVRELADGLSTDLAAELDRVSIPFDTPAPSDAELRIAHAQLVGWLEGLFHGIQATLVAQQVAARAQLDEMRQHALPAGEDGPVSRPGTYL